jgi:hypothetical protein
MIAPTDAVESGLAALPGRGPLGSLVPRLAAMATLPARLLVGLGNFGGGGARTLVAAATGVVAVFVVGGLLRLAVATVRADRGARTVLVPSVLTGVLVLILPGDAWYYYLDSLLPFWALAAGALVGDAAAPTGGLRDGRATERGGRGRRFAVWVALVAALVLASGSARWLRRVALAEYIPVDPIWLTLDGRPGRDAPSPGRILTLDAKRRAGALAAALGADAGDVWLRLHGPAYADATGDNGFWVRFAIDQRIAGRAPGDDVPPGAHVAFWYGDDPLGAALAALPPAPALAVTRVGPLVAATYRPRIDYAACQGDGGVQPLPIRVLPDPRRYGDGTPELPAALPHHVVCPLRDGAGTAASDAEQRLTAALGGAGTVRVSTDTRDGVAARESSLCVPAHGAGTVRLDVALDAGARADLDLYELPPGIGCERTQPAVPEE